MQTTIQVTERTLHILRKVKEQTHAGSYDEAINKLVYRSTRGQSLAGYLGRKPLKRLLTDLRGKHDRF